MRALCFLSISACGASSAARPVSAPVVVCSGATGTEQRPLRDCAAVRRDAAADQTELYARLDELTLDAPDRLRARQAVSTLGDAHRQLCDDWNACNVERPVFATRTESVAARRAELARSLADAAGGRTDALIAWSYSALGGTPPPSGPATEDVAARDAIAAERIAQAREQQAEALETNHTAADAATAAATAAAMRPVTAMLRESMAQAELHVRELDVRLAVIAETRAATVDAPPHDATTLPICEIRPTLERLRLLSSSSTLADAVDALCARLARWRSPDEDSRPHIVRYLQQIQRILGWMRDIRGCRRASAAEAARCANAYGQTQDAEADEARRIEALMAEHLRELDGVEVGRRPFPCSTPTLSRLGGMTFVGSVARAQMTALPRAAESVCQTLGVNDRALRDSLRELRIRLDQTESVHRSQRRSQLDLIDTIRAQLGE